MPISNFSAWSSSTSEEEWDGLGLPLGWEGPDACQLEKGSTQDLLVDTDAELLKLTIPSFNHCIDFSLGDSLEGELLATEPEPEPAPQQVDDASQLQNCPCCDEAVEFDFHAHVSKCFLRHKGTSSTPGSNSSKELLKQIHSVRKTLQKMNIHKRIGLMASLDRLASDSASLAMSSKAQEIDNLLIHLLYRDASRTKKHSPKVPRPLSPKIRNLPPVPKFCETTTPPHTALAAHRQMFSSTPPNSALSTSRLNPEMYSKRKLEFSEHFYDEDLNAFDFMQPRSKQQRIGW